MADLDDILIFVKVAQFESISRAARSLGMPISTVSRRLSVLESKLGVSLLRRTTRRVTLTAQGREYFNQCREPLTLLEEAERVLTLGQKTPEGVLRISVPVILGQEPFLNFLSGFLKAHARIRIDLFITNLFRRWVPVFPIRRSPIATTQIQIRAIAAENHMQSVPIRSLAGCIANTSSRPPVRD